MLTIKEDKEEKEEANEPKEDRRSGYDNDEMAGE